MTITRSIETHIEEAFDKIFEDVKWLDIDVDTVLKELIHSAEETLLANLVGVNLHYISEFSDAYDEGFENGVESGFAEGYEEGHEKGYEEGYSEVN